MSADSSIKLSVNISENSSISCVLKMYEHLSLSFILLLLFEYVRSSPSFVPLFFPRNELR